MSRAKRLWPDFAAADRELEEAASPPGAVFRWGCPCGAEFQVPTGPTGPAEVRSLSVLHMETAHPGLMEEIQDLIRRGVAPEFGAIFVANWHRSVRQP